MSFQTSNISSYPPKLRPTHQPDPSDDQTHLDPQAPALLPIIDMASLDEGRLHVACSEWGVFRLVNHGIPEGLIARLQAEAKALFDLDFESKQGLLKDPNPAYSWGGLALTPAGVQTPMGSSEVGLEIIRLALHRPEITCHETPHEETTVSLFRKILEEYGEHMTRLAKELFQAMARNLKLDQHLVEKGGSHKYLDETTGLLRVNRYPPYSPSDEVDPQVKVKSKVKGLDAHTDSTVLTILLQDNVQGLEIFKDGLWHSVEPIQNTLIVNLGDMLQAMSDDEYKSVEHKVTLNKRQERISVGYFVFPEDDTLVTKSKGKYRQFTNKDFRAQVQEDFAKLGWKVGLSRFRA